PVSAVAISKDGETIASVSQDQTLRIWITRSGAMVRTIQCEGCDRVAIAPSGQEAVTVGGHNVVTLWDISSGRVLKTFRAPGDRASLSLDGRLVAVGSQLDKEKGPLEVWDVATARRISAVGPAESRVGALGLSPDGEQLISALEWLASSDTRMKA